MDEVKKRLKILLRPGEPERRPQLTWPKSFKKEPVEVVAVGLFAFLVPKLAGLMNRVGGNRTTIWL